MRSTPKRLYSALAGAVCLLGTVTPLPITALAETPAEHAPLIAFSGSDSRIVKPGFRRITTAKAWEELWRQHTGKAATSFGDKSGMPRINFDECMVVAIFSGSSLANDGVTVRSVSEDADQITLRYRNRYYQIGMPDAATKAKAAKSGAFGLFVIPRSTKPIVLEEAVVHRIGQPAVPTVRAELPASG